jgi:hypothetical protein
MNWPPMLMHVKIKNKDNDFGIWIPFILLLLIAFAVVIALLPLIMLAVLILLMVGLERFARLTLWGIWTAFVAAWSLKGLTVDVENARERVLITVI